MPWEMPDPADAREQATAWLKRWWAWLSVSAMVVWMFIVRMRPFSEFRRGEAVFFLGTDPYYHARHIRYSVENFPSTLQYDAMTQYPLGTDPGQFGTLFDQLGAALAWVVGLVVDGGHPSPETVQAVTVAYPAVLGALLAIPVFLLARRLAGQGPAVLAAGIVALTPGRILFDSLAGRPDHHVIEALLSTLALWALVRAYQMWQESNVQTLPVVRDPRELLHRGYRSAWLATGVGALAFTAYLYAWSPGVLFVGIAGLWVLLAGVTEHLRGRDLAPLSLTSTGVFLPTAVLLVPKIAKPGFTALTYTWMQPTMALLVAGTGVGLAATAYLVGQLGWPRWTHPATTAGAGGVGFLALSLIFPGFFDHVRSGLSWITGIGVQRTRLTIAEAQPSEFSAFTDEVGLMLFTAILGLAWLVWTIVREQDRGQVLVLAWAVLMTTGALTQSRFTYYLVIAIAVLNAILLRGALDLADRHAGSLQGSGAGKRSKRQRASREPDPAAARNAKVLVAGLLVVALLPVNVLAFECGGQANAYVKAGCFGPGEEQMWRGSLVWLDEHSPPLEVSLSTQFQDPPGKERFEYPPGTYGVLSWWDYGHQILYDGERPPIANPFQQQAPLASRIFTAAGEGPAMEVLDGYLGVANQARYLMIDDAMVSTKFSAITVWASEHAIEPGVDPLSTYRDGGTARFTLPEGGQRVNLPVLGDEVESWFLQRVYHGDGSGMEHWRLVHESNAFSFLGNRGRTTEDGSFRVQEFNTILGRASADQTREQFRPFTRGQFAPFIEDGHPLNFESGDLGLPGGGTSMLYDVRVQASLKTFERVAGATLVGTGAEPGSTVQLQLPLTVANNGRTFSFTTTALADDGGAWSVTVPYSTGAPVPLEEGGTDTDVTATGPYRVTDGNTTATVEVPDRVVLEGGSVDVALS